MKKLFVSFQIQYSSIQWSPKVRQKQITFLFCLIFGFTTNVFAATSSDVSLDDPIYRYVDQLFADGLIKTQTDGQRPWTRLEVARLYLEAENKISSRQIDAAEWAESISIMDWIAHQYAEEITYNKEKSGLRGISFAPLESIVLESAALYSPSRSVVDDNGLGRTDALINPLIASRGSRSIPDGGIVAMEATHSLRLGRFLFGQLDSRLALQGERVGGPTINPSIVTGLAKVGWGNFEIAAGKSNVVWGPASFGGPFFSTSSPSMPIIRLSTPHPFRLPSFLRYIGEIKGTTFVADMRSYEPKHTILSGYRLEIRPHSVFSLSINHAVQMGGVGRNDPTIPEAISEFFGVSGAISPGGGRASSNHLFGIDMHARFQKLNGMQAYILYANEDIDGKAKIFFDQQAAWTVGLYLPRLKKQSPLGARIEFVRAGDGLYRHKPYIGGWSHGTQSLGLPFAGDSNALIFKLEHQSVNKPIWGVSAWLLQRSGDTYSTISNISGDRIAISKTSNLSDEYSASLVANTKFNVNKRTSIQIFGGLESVWNENFNANAQSLNWLSGFRLGLTI